jgi:hypothetical protein
MPTTWYVAPPQRETMGPLPTLSVVAALRAGAIPITSEVCEVGARTWTPIALVQEFAPTVAAMATPGTLESFPPLSSQPEMQSILSSPAHALPSTPRPDRLSRHIWIAIGVLVGTVVLLCVAAAITDARPKEGAVRVSPPPTWTDEPFPKTKEQLAPSLHAPTPLPSWLGAIPKLGADPAGQKAKRLPSGGEPHVTYQATIAGLGDVLIWVSGPGQWEVFLPVGQTDVAGPEELAPPEGLRALDRFGDFARHFEVTAGPLKGHFLVQSPGGVGVRPRARACSGNLEALPKLSNACR